MEPIFSKEEIQTLQNALMYYNNQMFLEDEERANSGLLYNRILSLKGKTPIDLIEVQIEHVQDLVEDAEIKRARANEIADRLEREAGKGEDHE